MFKLYYEAFTEQFFVSTPEAVNEAKYELMCEYVRNFGRVSLNYWLKCLGLGPIKHGDELGWNVDIGEFEYGYSSIEIFEDEFKKYTELRFIYPPTSDFDTLEVPPYNSKKTIVYYTLREYVDNLKQRMRY